LAGNKEAGKNRQTLKPVHVEMDEISIFQTVLKIPNESQQFCSLDEG
jgi:hypothetical protein